MFDYFVNRWPYKIEFGHINNYNNTHVLMPMMTDVCQAHVSSNQRVVANNQWLAIKGGGGGGGEGGG